MKWKIFLIFIALIVSNIVQAIDEDINDDAIVTDFDEPEVNESPETPPEEEILYVSPTPNARFYFAEHFDDNEQFLKKWVKSAAMKDGIDADIAKYDGEWAIETPQREKLQGDLGLVLKSKAKHAAISSRLSKPFVFNDKPLVVQYEVTLQDGQECGGAYIKLLSAGKETADLKQFQDKTPYTIMFGPDKCGNEHKLHFIFRHKNPKNGTIEEKHCKRPKDRLEEPFKDKLPHLFTLILYPDNTFEIKLDHHTINEGSLLDDFTPSVNPPAEIDDPNDQKPENWDEREKIADPEAFKPDDWDDDAPPQIPDKSAVKPDGWLDDEPDLIPDPKAIKPADWDSEMDGEWEAPLIANPACEGASGCGQWKQPMISNPEYKGKWRPPMIDNPNYKGKWRPRRIPNPDFFEDKNPFRMTSIVAVGIELWSMSKDILFDNIIITDDLVAANQWATETFDLKRRKIDKDAESLWTRMVRFTNDNPWIWVVYVLVIGLPLVLIVFFCCSISPSQQRENEELRKAAESKKTDSVSNDDVNDHGDANEVIEEIPQAATTKSSLEETESEATPQTNDETVVEAPRKRRPRKD